MPGIGHLSNSLLGPGITLVLLIAIVLWLIVSINKD